MGYLNNSLDSKVHAAPRSADGRPGERGEGETGHIDISLQYSDGTTLHEQMCQRGKEEVRL